MLVLSRKLGEKIMIGDTIVVEVVAIRQHGKSAAIGVTAPDGVLILRDELTVRAAVPADGGIRG